MLYFESGWANGLADFGGASTRSNREVVNKQTIRYQKGRFAARDWANDAAHETGGRRRYKRALKANVRGRIVSWSNWGFPAFTGFHPQSDSPDRLAHSRD